jgi:hypothetical protein
MIFFILLLVANFDAETYRLTKSDKTVIKMEQKSSKHALIVNFQLQIAQVFARNMNI